MSKRKKTEIDSYTEKVDLREIDGDFEEKDQCAKYKEPLMTTAQKKESFTIRALLYNGKPTGYGQCSSERCRKLQWTRKNKNIFKIQEGVRSGSKWQLIERHLTNYHVEDAQTKMRKPQKGIQQTLLSNARKKLPDSVIAELRENNCNLVAQCHTPLNHFSKEAVRKRDQILLRAGNFDEAEVFKFDRTGPTTKRDLEKQSDAQFNFLKEVIPELAKQNLLALAVDHKSILNLKNQKLDTSAPELGRPKDALGLQLVLCAHDGKRYSYLLEFCAVPEKTNEATINKLKSMLQESAHIKLRFLLNSI